MELRFHFIFSVFWEKKKKTCWRKLIQFPSTNCWHTGAAVPPGCYPQEPSLQFLPALTLVHTLQVWKTWIASSCVCVFRGVCVYVWGGGAKGDCRSCALVGLERLFPLFALCFSAQFLGSGCVLTCIAFACWLMLCLWERRAWCEVNSCASQYHRIPLLPLS